MNHAIRAGVILLLVAATASLAWAADDAPKKKNKKNAAAKQPQAIANVMKKVEALDLTAEQKAKLKEIEAEYTPQFVEAQQHAAQSLTPEQKQARAAAVKAARAEGKKGKELKEAIDAAVNLTDEQKRALEESAMAHKKVAAAFTSAVKSVLTEEQRENAKLGGKKAKKAKKAK